MPRVTRTYSAVRVVGHIWQPGCGLCAYEYSLSASDVENIGEPTRENVEQWLTCHSGDFQSIEDFSYSVGDAEWSPWASEDNECAYWDAMCPAED